MCTLHWYSNLIPMLHDARRLEERLTVVVGDSTELKLLGVSGYEQGMDEPCRDIIARLISKLLREWLCADNVINILHHVRYHRFQHRSPHCGLYRH